MKIFISHNLILLINYGIAKQKQSIKNCKMAKRKNGHITREAIPSSC
ncbi:MAG: hypothetical protein ACYCTB_00090 [bacterium]